MAQSRTPQPTQRSARTISISPNGAARTSLCGIYFGSGSFGMPVKRLIPHEITIVI